MKTKNIILIVIVAVIFAVLGFFGGNKLAQKGNINVPEASGNNASANVQTSDDASLSEENLDEENPWGVTEPLSEAVKAIFEKQLPNFDTTELITKETEKLYQQCDEMKGEILKNIEKYHDNMDDAIEAVKEAIKVEDIQEEFLDYYEDNLELIKEMNEWEEISVSMEYWNGTFGAVELAVRENNAVLHLYEELCKINQRYI